MGVRAGPRGQGLALEVSGGELTRWIEKIARVIEDWGDLRVEDAGANGPTRVIEFSLDCPGDGLATEVRTIYRETYVRQEANWRLVKYTYEFHDYVLRGRLAYHWHEVGAPPAAYHAHCEEFDPASPLPEQDHLRAIPVGLLEAHDDFTKYYAAGASPDCASFRPLEVTR